MPVRRKNEEQPEKEFLRIFHTLDCSKHRWEVWKDFCELSALSLAQVPHPTKEREERYMKLIGMYSWEEAQEIKKLFHLVVVGLGEDMEVDFLGKLFMELELGSHWKGQFFTPMNLCLLMAQLTLTKEAIAEHIERDGFTTGYDCAVGAGATMIALAGQIRRLGFNPQRQLHVTATDVDPTAAHMAYIQLSMLGIPATVFVGNTLTLDIREVWHTVFHHLGGWQYRLKGECMEMQAYLGRTGPGKAPERTVGKGPSDQKWSELFAMAVPKPLARKEPPPAEAEEDAA